MAREDYRRGMLYGFAAAGLTPEEVGELVIETGMDKAASLLNTVRYQTPDPVTFNPSETGGNLLNAAGTVLTGLPLALGALGGAAAYQTFGPNYKADIDALRTQDIINEIKMRKRDVQRTLARKGVVNA